MPAISPEDVRAGFFHESYGSGYDPGYFLASADCERHTYEYGPSDAVEINGRKLVLAGTKHGTSGFVYETVDLTNGSMPISVVTKGSVYRDRLPEELSEEDEAVFVAKGFTFVDEKSIARPFY